MLFEPYVENGDDRLAQLCQLLIFMSLLCLIVLNYDSTQRSASSSMDVLLSVLALFPFFVACCCEKHPFRWRKAATGQGNDDAEITPVRRPADTLGATRPLANARSAASLERDDVHPTIERIRGSTSSVALKAGGRAIERVLSFGSKKEKKSEAEVTASAVDVEIQPVQRNSERAGQHGEYVHEVEEQQRQPDLQGFVQEGAGNGTLRERHRRGNIIGYGPAVPLSSVPISGTYSQPSVEHELSASPPSAPNTPSPGREPRRAAAPVEEPDPDEHPRLRI